jgi:hypothetical protein
MKARKILKIGIGFILIIGISLLSFKSFAHKTKVQKQDLNDNYIEPTDTIYNPEFVDANVSVTIDSNTNDNQIDEIVNMLKENGITPSLTHIKRDEESKITGIAIKLTDNNGNQASSQISSSIPISQIVFGRKDGSLFITQGKNNANDIFAILSTPNMSLFDIDNDSLIKQRFKGFGNFNFDDFFNDDDTSTFLFNGKSMTLKELKEQMEAQLSGNMNPNALWFFDNKNNSNKKQAYSFIDDPNTNKLIIINGEISDFNTLDALSKNNNIKALDILKPETAISIYGNKARDGAIIATTKN